MLHMFNSNICTDFRTACKHVLIPIYVIQGIQQNQSFTQLNINWLLGGWTKINIWNWMHEAIFYFTVLFDKKHSKTSRQILYRMNSFSPPRHPFFFIPLQNLRLNLSPPLQKRDGILCWFLLNIFHILGCLF